MLSEVAFTLVCGLGGKVALHVCNDAACAKVMTQRRKYERGCLALSGGRAGQAMDGIADEKRLPLQNPEKQTCGLAQPSLASFLRA